MKKIFLILIFLLNLCIEINQTGMRLCLSAPTASAQYMGNESFYNCEDDGIEYPSPWPCEDDPCIQACTYPDCDVSLPCDEIILHQYEAHPEDDPFDDEDPDDNNSGDGDLWGDTDTGGSEVVDPPVTPPSPGDGVVVGDDEYVEIGKAYWDKMEEDVRNNNFVVYKATIIDATNKTLDGIQTASLAVDANDFILDQMGILNNNKLYKVLAQRLSMMGFAIDASQTAVLLMEKDFDEYTTSDLYTIMGTGLTGVGLILGTGPWGAAFMTAGLAVAIVNVIMFNEINIKLNNGKILNIKRMQA